MDRRDWAAIRAIAADDILAELGTGELRGRDALIALLRSYLDRCGTTQHLLGNVVIEVSGDTARSRAYVCDMHLNADDAPQQSFRTLGEYSDQWRKIGGRWRLCHRVKDNRASVGSMQVFGN